MRNAIDELRNFKLSPEKYERYMLHCFGLETSDRGTSVFEDGIEFGRKKVARKMLAEDHSVEIICNTIGLKREEFK